MKTFAYGKTERTLMEDITINPFQPEDLDGVLGLLNKELIADPMTAETFVRKVLLDLNFDREGALVARRGGRVVGFMLGIVRRHPLEDGPPDYDRGWINLFAVDDGFLRQGVGTRLIEGLLDYFRRRDAKAVLVATYAPNYFCPGIDEAAYPGAIEFLKKHGFEVVHRPLSMDASLVSLETPEWIREKESKLRSEGVEITPFQYRHILPLLDHLRECFPGDWQRHVRDSMVRRTLGTFNGEIYVAMYEGKCLGFCQHDGERFGPYGVDERERGRGIGAVLLLACLHGMRARGLHNAWFMSTTDQAAKLYAEGGFRETRRYAVMKLDLE